VNAVGDSTRYEYDDLNRVTAVYGPGDTAGTRTYCGPIYTDSVVDPIGGKYRFVHNALGWVTEGYGPATDTIADRYGYNGGERGPLDEPERPADHLLVRHSGPDDRGDGTGGHAPVRVRSGRL
jgi:hypothetical protein